MHGQQNIILRCTVSRILHRDARSAEHYTEMHGQQNLKKRYNRHFERLAIDIPKFKYLGNIIAEDEKNKEDIL